MKASFRRSVVLALTSILLGVSVSAPAQQQTKLPKIGWLDSGPTVRGTRLGDLFQRRLGELGFIDGKNLLSNIDLQRISWSDSPPLLVS
jgi:hypothetical protein